MASAKGRVLDIDLDRPAKENWKEVVHEGATPITDLSVAGGKMFTTTLENVASKCSVYKLDGAPLGDIKLPTLGTLSDLDGEEDGTDAFVQFSSFAYPTSILKIATDNTASIWWRMAVPLALDQIDMKQVWYASKDGTKIPMFIVNKKGQAQGNRPTLLSGYGGFNIAMIPHWSSLIGWWVNQGGVFAVPGLRGGGEFGESWHRAGMFEKKQNSFDDFIGAAEYLIQCGVTSRAKLAILGGSNGGLLVGAAMTQRPDLFSAVVCAAPLLDMIRYQRFREAKFWVSEYGSADDPKQFEYLYRYSPYHHVEKGRKYPAVLFVSGDSDTRVDPLHARKMAALMQSAAARGGPILLRYDTLVGLSGGMSVDRQLDLDRDILAFLKSQIG
jgi:prolyl oligopeptidase